MTRLILTKHEKAVVIERLIGSFMSIKKLPRYTGDIDRICDDGVSKLCYLADVEGCQKELDEIRQRRIDPTG